MKIVYGKFDPISNPLLFLNWVPQFEAIEVDLFQYFTWDLKLLAKFKSWIELHDLRIVLRASVLKKRDTHEYNDAFESWVSLYGDKTIYYSIYSGRGVWDANLCLTEIKKLPQNHQFFFEWGQKDSTLDTKFLSELACFGGFVIDPDWHSSSISRLKPLPLQFKLHGWNEERWVRRYGDKKIASILKRLIKLKHSALTLSYSGKVVEAPHFASAAQF